MDPRWLPVALPVLGLAACVLVQVLAFRVRRRAGLLTSLATGALGGLGAAAALTAWWWETHGASPSERLGTAAANLVLYLALTYGYFHFVNLGETARRIRLLRELVEAPGPLTRAEVLARYDGRSIVAVRLGRLLRKGQVRLEGGRYVIGRPLMLGMARLIVGLKLLVLGRRSERG